MSKKFHWLLHLPRELETFKTLLSCWVHEQKHRMVKRYADNARHGAEKTILSEVTAHAIHELAHPIDLTPRLLDPRPADKLLRKFLALRDHADLMMSPRARVSEFEICHKRDCVIRQISDGVVSLCEVWIFTSSEGRNHALVAIWHLSGTDVSSGSCTCVMSDDLKVVDLTTLLTACIHRRNRDGTATVLIPLPTVR